MRWARVSLAACGVLLLAACTAQAGVPTPPEGPRVLVVAPDAAGDCSRDAPCGFRDALERAGGGTRIELTSGDYGDLAIDGMPRYATFDDAVVVTAAADAAPVVTGLRIAAPHVHLLDLPVAGLLSFDPGSDGGTAERVHVTGSGMFVRADGIEVRDSLLEGGSSVDGIQIARASDVLVESTVIRDYDQSGDNGRHADCIQIFDVERVVIRGNRLANCYNAGIILSGGGRGIQGLLIESNYVQGCVVKSSLCGGGSAAELREQDVSDLVVRNNTFLDGSVRWGSAKGAVFDRNVVAYLSECGSRITNSLVLAWNTRMCRTPGWLDADGNRTGEYEPRDRHAGDLAPVDAAQALITPVGTTRPAPTDIDGHAIPADVAGATVGG